MTPKDYSAARIARGDRKTISDKLGISEKTLARRENGTAPITKEMVLAINALGVPSSVARISQPITRAERAMLPKGNGKLL